MPINPILLQEVKRAMALKNAFVPPGAGAPPGAPPMDPAAAGGAPPMDPAMMGAAPPGAPPMDPSMMGGAPPMDPAMMAAMGGGGAPPMDPAMMGGAPPMDPAAMGGAPPAPPAPSPDDIKKMVTEAVQAALGGASPDGAAKPKAKGGGKVDPAQMLEYMERQQKLLINLYESLGLNLPYDILDKPAPEGEDAQEPVVPSKEQGSDASVGGIPPIKPIEPIGGKKEASLKDKTEAVRCLINAMGFKR